jgi:AcrR family transcriptional regulator
MSNQTSPLKRRRAKTRQEILAAAREIIVTQGVEALSMRSLAQKVDYTPAALYKYFESKEALVEEIRVEGWDLMAAYYRDHLPPAEDAAEMLYNAAVAYQEFALAYPAHYLLMFQSVQAAPQKLDELYQDAKFLTLLKLIEQGAASGQIIMPPGYTALMLRWQFWSMSHGMAMLQLTLLKNVQTDAAEMFRQVIRANIDSLTGKKRT